MELRSVLLTIALSLGVAGGSRAAIRDYPLDERAVYTIRVGTDEPTTCLFPEPLAALESANLSAKAEDNPPVLLSHASGASYFSVRALRPGATAAANVLLGGRAYALYFIADGEPERIVRFRTGPIAPSMQLWRELLRRARGTEPGAARMADVRPAIPHAEPDAVTRYPRFRVVVEAAFRFDAEEALVLRLRLENPGSGSVAYDPEGLAVRVGREVYPAVFAEASGLIPAQGTAFAYLVVVGHLSEKAAFNVLVPCQP